MNDAKVPGLSATGRASAGVVRTTRRPVALAVLGVILAGAMFVAAPSGTARPDDPAGSPDLARVRRVTAQYHDVARAEADGFVSTHECVSSPDGTMGIHFVHFGRIDTVVDIDEPEVLVYLPEGDRLRLVAVEYLQVDEDQDVSTSDDRPSLFGRAFDGPMPGHGPGEPVHYDLHVWVWRHNPAGTLAPWNPAISCPA